METSLSSLSSSGMMHSQKVFKGLIVYPAVHHNIMKEPYPETTSPLVNTRLSTALEQQREGEVISIYTWYVT